MELENQSFPTSDMQLFEENDNSDTRKAAVKLQKVYRSYQTRRRLADSALVAERLWWHAIDYARLNHSTVSFFDYSKPETAASRWNRMRLNASKVGKGLSKDDKALKLSFQHWIEAIDPRHRYGHNLNIYYDEWCQRDTGQPFFYWLDIGDGKEVDLDECPRSKLRQECIKYLGPQERENYEYTIADGTLLHKETGDPLNTICEAKCSKWIFVMSATKRIYAAEKKKGFFHHSSFLAGGATLAAGRLEAESGKLKSLSAYSGHYRPTDENLGVLLGFLKDSGVNLEEVQVITHTQDYRSCDIGILSQAKVAGMPTDTGDCRLQATNNINQCLMFDQSKTSSFRRTLSSNFHSPRMRISEEELTQRIEPKKEASSYQLERQLTTKWSMGAGPRIGYIADYPQKLREQALEFVNLPCKNLPSSSSSQLSSGLVKFKNSCNVKQH